MTRTVEEIVSDELASQGLWFSVVDVGVSGGIHPLARRLPKVTRAVGFDGLKEEVDRLKESESGALLDYQWALVGDPSWAPVSRGEQGVYERSTAAAFDSITGHDYVREVFNRGAAPTYPDHLTQLDVWFRESGWGQVDFLKIDTDGHDLGVLRSASETLATALAVYIETPFDGALGPDANTFANIFTELTSGGYRLFDLSTWRYSRVAFPMPFKYEIPAQTTRGQVFFGDALFMRDLAVEGDVSASRVLKMVVLLDFFDLQDCAVELLESERTTGLLSCATKDELTLALGERSPLKCDPRQARALFERDPAIYFPSRREDLGANFDSALRSDSESEPPHELSESRVFTLNRESLGDCTPGPGWHLPETLGSWSAQSDASIEMSCPHGLGAGQLVVRMGSVESTRSDVSVAVVLNGILVGHIEPLAIEPTQYRFEIPDAVHGAREICLTLLTGSLWSPGSRALSQDDRELGIFVMDVALEVA